MSDNRSDHFILFIVAGTTYALPSHEVAHVEMVEQITRVPNAPAFVDGVVFSRGQVVPAVNLRARFGFERVPADIKTRLLVVQSGSPQHRPAGRRMPRVPDDSRLHDPSARRGALRRSAPGISPASRRSPTGWS